jgi:hypothetical protein
LRAGEKKKEEELVYSIHHSRVKNRKKQYEADPV